MGCSANAAFVSGVRISMDEDLFLVPNPLYGIHRFDPNTGLEIRQFIPSDVLKFIRSFLDNNEGYDYKNPKKGYQHSFISEYYFGFYGVVFLTSSENYGGISIPESIPNKPDNYNEFIYFLKANKVNHEEGQFLVSTLNC